MVGLLPRSKKVPLFLFPVLQRCNVCCLRTYWCSSRSRMTRWSSNATVRVTSLHRTASWCWAQLLSWTQSFFVMWPQVSSAPQYSSLQVTLIVRSVFELLFSPVVSDRKAFYVIFTWESGAQIYELVAQSVGEMKRWMPKRIVFINHVSFWFQNAG